MSVIYFSLSCFWVVFSRSRTIVQGRSRKYSKNSKCCFWPFNLVPLSMILFAFNIHNNRVMLIVLVDLLIFRRLQLFHFSSIRIKIIFLQLHNFLFQLFNMVSHFFSFIHTILKFPIYNLFILVFCLKMLKLIVV